MVLNGALERSKLDHLVDYVLQDSSHFRFDMGSAEQSLRALIAQWKMTPMQNVRSGSEGGPVPRPIGVSEEKATRVVLYAKVMRSLRGRCMGVEPGQCTPIDKLLQPIESILKAPL
jgi:hypothetical protein